MGHPKSKGGRTGRPPYTDKSGFLVAALARNDNVVRVVGLHLENPCIAGAGGGVAWGPSTWDSFAERMNPCAQDDRWWG